MATHEKSSLRPCTIGVRGRFGFQCIKKKTASKKMLTVFFFYSIYCNLFRTAFRNKICCFAVKIISNKYSTQTYSSCVVSERFNSVNIVCDLSVLSFVFIICDITSLISLIIDRSYLQKLFCVCCFRIITFFQYDFFCIDNNY